MRASSPSLVSSVSTALLLSFAVVGTAVFAGCGDDEKAPVTNPPADSGTPVADSSVTLRDSSAPVGDGATDARVAADREAPPVEDAAAPVCTNDASLDTLEVPDAAVADGGLDPVACVACSKTSCGTEFKNCNGECTCREAVSTLLSCLGTLNGGDPTTCLAPVFSSPSIYLQPFGICVGQSCAAECGLGNLGGGDQSFTRHVR